MSKIPPVAKVKEPLWTTMRKAWGPYKRLYSYALPYKWRFVVGLAFGFLYGFINGLMPLVMAKVAGVVFQGKAAVPPQQMVQHPELFTHGPQDRPGLDPALSRDPGCYDCPQSLRLRQRLLHELGQQQGADRHSGPALQQDDPPIDGFL
jgi:hypothetical protein